MLGEDLGDSCSQLLLPVMLVMAGAGAAAAPDLLQLPKRVAIIAAGKRWPTVRFIKGPWKTMVLTRIQAA